MSLLDAGEFDLKLSQSVTGCVQADMQSVDIYLPRQYSHAAL
jgi:hypothetical protein